MQLSYTLIFIVITVGTSLMAFNNDDIKNKFLLFPFGMSRRPTEYYRIITHALIHGDFAHLAFNMFALYLFGGLVEDVFARMGKPLVYPLLYILGIITASLPSMAKHKDHSYYTALGASGGVSAVIFSFIYFAPWRDIYIFFIPIGIPGFIFGVLYLAYSSYMSKKGGDNIAHDAHLWGAVFGFLMTFLYDPTHGKFFIEQLMNPKF